jgi:hypothetical protein
MTLRFRKSIAVMPGVRLNLGKRGLSVRIGTRGFGHTIGTSGRRTTIGLPGSGVSFTKVHRRVPQSVAARSYDAPAAPDTRQEQHHAGNQKAEIKPGRDRRESTPIGSKVRYAQNRHRPVGQWVQTTLAESVVGVHHRKPMAIAFARAAREAEAKGLIYGWLTAVWLATVYVQRFVALILMGRRVLLTAFLIEPFSTQFFHLCAMTLVIYTIIRRAFGIHSNVWTTRARLDE